MPSLTRFVFIVAVIGLGSYACMVALADLVEPPRREIVTTVQLHPKTAAEPNRPKPGRNAAKPRQAAQASLVNTLENLPFARR